MSIVMIAESEPGTRQQLEQTLLEEKHSVEWVGNADELQKRVEMRRPDLLVLDLRMPKLDASSVVERLRSVGLYLPILTIAAKNDVPSAIPDWAVDFLTKPLDIREVVWRINRALSRGQSKYAPVSHPQLCDPKTGRIDAKNVAEFLGVPLSQLAQALDVEYATVHKTPASTAIQKSLYPIKRAIELVSRITRNPPEARMWINHPHPDLGERTPLSVILAGKAEALVTILENALAGIPS